MPTTSEARPQSGVRRSLLPAVFGGALGGIAVGVVIVLGLVGAYSLFTYYYGDPLGLASKVPSPAGPAPAARTREATPVEDPPASATPAIPAAPQFQRAYLRDESVDSYEKVFRASMPRGSVAVAIDGPYSGKSPFSESYLFRARAGQWFAVRLIPKGSSNPFFAVSDALTDSPLTPAAESRGMWAQTLPMSGDFAIRVCCDGAFRLEVVIR